MMGHDVSLSMLLVCLLLWTPPHGRHPPLQFRSWGSVIGMLPGGGNRVWGTLNGAPDDNAPIKKANATYGCGHAPTWRRHLASLHLS